MLLSGRPLLATAADERLLVARPEAEMLIRHARAGLNTLLLAEPGMGETTLLRHLGARLDREAGFYAVYIDGHRFDGALAILRAVHDAVVGTPDPLDKRFHAAYPAGSSSAAQTTDDDQALTVIRAIAASVGDPACVLLDDPDPQTAHQLFGRLRDELWQTGLVWIVAGAEARRREYLTPPADAFFERVMTLAPLTSAQQEDLIRRRLDDEDDRQLLTVRAENGNPRTLLATLRDATTTGDVALLLTRRGERQRAADKLGRLAGMMLAEIEDGATASASDTDWLARYGISRQRAQQVLAELEHANLVRTDRLPGPTGRPRKVYRRRDSDA